MQLLCNHKIDFEPPRITGKPPIFGVDKWIEEHNRSIASRFVKIVRQIEELYRKYAEQQIQAVQNNALLDYRELKWLQQEYARLTDLNDNQTEQMQTFLDQLAEPSLRKRIFSIADALIGGGLLLFHPVMALATPTPTFAGMKDGRRLRKRCIEGGV